MPSFCEINKKAKIYIHEKAFETTYGTDNGKLDEEPCSIRWTESQRESFEDRLILTGGAVRLSEDIVVSGTIPKRKDFIPTESFYRKNEDAAEEMEYILPVHCTGIRAICDLKLMTGDRCIPAGAGDGFEF